MSIYLFQRWILHIKSIPIFQNKSIKSGFMAIYFKDRKSSDFVSGSTWEFPVGNLTQPYHPSYCGL